jgi:hypothetical protein
MRINTVAGPRTVVAGTVLMRDASHIAAAMHSAGHYVEMVETGAIVSLAAHMKKHKAAMKRRAKAAITASNITRLPLHRKAGRK